jgi:hypothetical protein
VPDLVAVHARLLELVGTSGPEISGRADRRDFARFALACGDEDPGTSRRRCSCPRRSSGAPGRRCTSCARTARAPPATFLPLDGLRLMGGGQELELGEDIVHGTQFTARPTLEDVALRDGRSGPLLILRLRTEFRATDGRLLVTSRETILAREPAA